jgi:peroxiredoxin
MLKVGDRAPDFILRDPDGREYRLDSFLEDQRALLMIFLRHLG